MGGEIMEEECSICHKKKEKDENWMWGEEPAHKLCVLNEAQVACDNMCCFDMDDGAQDECECGLKLKPITERERKALLV